jgi:predicted methyltransferase
MKNTKLILIVTASMLLFNCKKEVETPKVTYENTTKTEIKANNNTIPHIYLSPWVRFNIASLFKEAKLIQDWVADETFDLIYYDAFGPRAQAEMWELPIFEKLYSLLNVDGALVTYCAQGQFKRHLKSLGMRVDSLPGPPGKREMTRGIKI